ncbi:MAG TPA: hypothetical protein VF668_08140 [Pyrinomonadaceae bacterium]|jgi:hypothetical protein
MNSLTQFLGSSFVGALVGAVIGAVLKGLLDRRLAKRAPKTDRRAQAYQDFVTHMLSAEAPAPGAEGAAAASSHLNGIKARLIVFGESEVVCEVARFLCKHQDLNSPDAKQDFGEVIRAMRKSVATGSGAAVLTSVSALLSLPKQR